MDTFDADLIGHLVECTATENQTCKIAHKLSVMNKLLLGSMVQLGEWGDTSDQLYLVDNHINCIQSWTDSVAASKLPQHPELLAWLLRTHHCITSALITSSLVNNTGLNIEDALRHSSGIRTLTLFLNYTSVMKAASAIIPWMTHLKELYCHPYLLSTDPGAKPFVAALLKLVNNSSSLESLSLSCFTFDVQTAHTFFTTLSHKSTLKKLDLQCCSLECDTYPYALTEYLATTTLLRMLSVDMTNELVQVAVLDGVSKNSSILELTFGKFAGDEESTAIMAGVIRSNRVIRSLTIQPRDDTAPWLQTSFHCWIPPLIENEILEEVNFPLSIFRPSQWAAFFQALPLKENLKKVYIDAGADEYQLLSPVCTKLVSSGSEEKVSISSYYFRHDTDLLQCKAFSKVQFLRPDEHTVAALRILPSCQHLTSVYITIERSSTTIFSALAELVEASTALRWLELRSGTGVQMEVEGDIPGWSHVVEALSRNDSLRALVVSLHKMSIQDKEALADSVSRSKSIRYIDFVSHPKGGASAFVRRLAKDIDRNHTLLTADCSDHLDADAARDWLAVQDTTSRNSGVVTRAARFLKASHLDRYVNGALERVLSYPALLTEVAEFFLNINQSELVSLAGDRLKGTKSLGGFMRFAGVVKEGVLCHPSDDGRMQLDDLNEDCWMHVRRYLFIDDVKEGIGPP